MTSPPVLQRVAAMLAAYESRSIDAAELHGRLLKAQRASGSADALAWAAARFWRRTAGGA